MTVTTQVLISGGSSVGMSTAVFLARQGVSCIVVERKPGPTGHPGFRGLSARTMELYRAMGVEDAIHAVTGEQHRSGWVAQARNLSDPDVRWFDTVPWTPEQAAVSPSVFATCDQDLLEPVLRDRARELGADVRYGTELTAVEQDAHEVRATVRDTETGETYEIAAQYLVAADGTHSPMRGLLGIGRTGPGVLEHRLNVLFETDLPAELQGRKLTACNCTDIRGGLVPRADRPWVMSIPADDDLDHDELLALIRKGVGRDDFTATIVDVFPWRPTAAMAERYRTGRIFLAGDAANVMPPTGGFGGNTGIQSAFNLSWKLAAVLSGEAGDALLDTYETERRPVEQGIVDEALLRLRSWYQEGDAERKPLPDNTVMFGYCYEGDLFEDPLTPTGRPGSRAPHVRLERDGAELSTVDLFGRGFVLLAGPDADAWEQAAVDVPCHRLGAELRDLEGKWTTSYGVGPAGAVLVRPDGFVAWRSPGAPEGDGKEVLRAVQARILHQNVRVQVR